MVNDDERLLAEREAAEREAEAERIASAEQAAAEKREAAEERVRQAAADLEAIRRAQAQGFSLGARQGPPAIGDPPVINTTRTVKLPPFWKENPTLWFAQAEAAFAISHVTADLTKYRYIVVSLDQAILPFISDIIADPPATGKYDTLKQRIISSFGETSESKLRQLLRGHEYTDEKPSNFLQRLRNLAAGQCNDTVLRTLFLKHLPDQVKGILAISEVTDLAKLALQADKIVEVTKPTISAVAHVGKENRSPAPVDSTLAEVLKKLDDMSREIGQLKSNNQRRSRNRSRGRSSSRGQTPNRGPCDHGELCYYHDRFGDKARKCREPCA